MRVTIEVYADCNSDESTAHATDYTLRDLLALRRRGVAFERHPRLPNAIAITGAPSGPPWSMEHWTESVERHVRALGATVTLI